MNTFIFSLMQDVLIFVQNVNLNCSYLGVLKIIAKSEQPLANVLQNKCSYIAIFTEKHLCCSLFWWTLLTKTTPTQALCLFGYCEIFKNNSFIEHLWWLLLACRNSQIKIIFKYFCIATNFCCLYWCFFLVFSI